MKYASFELNPCVYSDHEAWVLFDDKVGWKEVSVADVGIGAATLTKAQFDARFPHLPPMPKAAFHSAE